MLRLAKNLQKCYAMNMKKSIIGLFLISVFLLTSGAICSNSGTMPDPITLQYWSAEHNQEEIAPIIASFEALYPYVTIEYKKYAYEEYEDTLINSWAKGQGPDIFSIPNTHVKKYYDLISPLPPALTLTTVTTKKTFNKEEIIIEDIQQKTTTVPQLKNEFADVVASDVIFTHQGEKDKLEAEKIFGLPVSLDTLALYWNKDILGQASIAVPASNWQEVVDHTDKITKIDKDNNVLTSSVALGTTSNVPNYFDVLSMLMMQFGAVMVTEQGTVSFDKAVGEEKRTPGQEALDFYVKFAQEDWETYTWNENKANALDAFASGDLAYFVGYHYHLQEIQNSAPNLNFDIAALPQITPTNQVNYASYWVESVSSNADYSDIAWAFVEHLASETNSQAYVETAIKPAARRNLINSQLEDYELAIFSEQALTSQSWYHGKDPLEAKALFKQMIDNAAQNLFPIDEVIGDTARKMQLTL